MKTCYWCQQQKSETEFYDVKRRGLVFKTAECKACKKEYHKQYQSKNKEKMRNKQNKWFQQNKQKQYERVRDFKDRNPDRSRERNSRPAVRLARRLRTRLWYAIKDGGVDGSAVRDLGCAIEELKLYLESKFQSGMSWDNWGVNGWHIDHIAPLSSFDLTDPEQLKKACHYTNLQPLWAKDNLLKGSKVS